jgi:hypothetical protein
MWNLLHHAAVAEPSAIFAVRLNRDDVTATVAQIHCAASSALRRGAHMSIIEDSEARRT